MIFIYMAFIIIYYTVREPENSQDLQSGSWKLRRAIDVSSSVRAGSLESQEELVFQFESEGRKRQTLAQSSQAGDVAFFFYM